jgi:hypothetical protein
MCGVIFICAFN